MGADILSPCETKTKDNSVIKLKSFVTEKFPNLISFPKQGCQ